MEEPPRRLVLDTNVAIDIEDFYYGKPRVRNLLPALREFLVQWAGEERTHAAAPDINYGLAILEACSTRTIAVDQFRERRLRRALQVVLGWDREQLTKNFNNRHAPANRDPLLKRGLPLPPTDEAGERPGAMLTGRYGALLYICHLERSRGHHGKQDPLATLEKFMDWMTFELGARGVYETQVALDLFLGDSDRMNGARRLLKLGGREDPNTLANRAWNAAWDLEFLSTTERWTFGLRGSMMRNQSVTYLVTRNMDPAFVRLRSELMGVTTSGDGQYPLISLNWDERVTKDAPRVRAILEGGLSTEETARRLDADPPSVVKRALSAIADLERTMGATPSALGQLV